jgi:type III restriction enzyme
MDCSQLRYNPVDRELIAQLLRTNEQQTITSKVHYTKEQRFEDYLVKCLIDYDDIAYDEHADFLVWAGRAGRKPLPINSI